MCGPDLGQRSVTKVRGGSGSGTGCASWVKDRTPRENAWGCGRASPFEGPRKFLKKVLEGGVIHNGGTWGQDPVDPGLKSGGI